MLLHKGQFQAEVKAGRLAGGAARSSLVAGLENRDIQQQSYRSGTQGTGNERRYAFPHKGQQQTLHRRLIPRLGDPDPFQHMAISKCSCVANKHAVSHMLARLLLD